MVGKGILTLIDCDASFSYILCTGLFVFKFYLGKNPPFCSQCSDS